MQLLLWYKAQLKRGARIRKIAVKYVYYVHHLLALSPTCCTLAAVWDTREAGRFNEAVSHSFMQGQKGEFLSKEIRFLFFAATLWQ
jgi:uncharacterized membrane protein YesL